MYTALGVALPHNTCTGLLCLVTIVCCVVLTGQLQAVLVSATNLFTRMVCRVIRYTVVRHVSRSLSLSLYVYIYLYLYIYIYIYIAR